MYVLHVFTVGYYVCHTMADVEHVARLLGYTLEPLRNGVHTHWLRNARGENCGTVAASLPLPPAV